jgi:hypothetical protein
MSSNFNYCEPPDIPEGMTLAEWRRANSAKRKPRWRGRLRRRSRRAQGAPAQRRS